MNPEGIRTIHPAVLQFLQRGNPMLAQRLQTAQGAPQGGIAPETGGRNALTKLFAGFGGPGQSQGTDRQAMLAAGLQTLSSASQPNSNFLGSLTQGIAAGQQAAAGGQAQAVRQAQMQRIQSMVADGAADRESIQRLFVETLASGDTEGAKQIAEVLKSMPSESRGTLQKVTGPNGETILTDPQTGETVRTIGGPRGDLTRVDLGDRIVWHEQGKPNEIVHEERKGQSPRDLEQQDFSRTQGLASAYQGTIKDHQLVADSYATVVASAEDPSPAGDMSLIFAYMKMVDPGSTVREGEFANAQNSGSVPTRVSALYNQILSGERLTPNQRGDFVDRAGRVAATRQKTLQPIMGRYRSRAEDAGIDPGLFLFDPFAEAGLRGGSGGVFDDLVPGR